MRQIVINQYEKIVSVDLNNMQLDMAKSIQDDFAYNFFGQPAGGVIASSFICSYVSQFAFSLAAGVGFFYNSANTGLTPLFEEILSANAIAGVITANTNSNNRIDLVCLAPNNAVTSTASRFIKTGGVGPVVATTVNKTKDDTYTLQVVVGTPGSSPAAPALPSGYIAIAQILNLGSSGGMTSGSNITDERNVFTLGVSNAGHVIATGTTIQTQLDEIDANIKLTTGATIRTVTSNQAMVATDGLLRSNSTSGSLTHTLPSISTVPTGKVIQIKDVGSGAHTTTVQGYGGTDTIDGNVIYASTLGQYDTLSVKSNGTTWDVV
jgi:hypothetical protein